MTTMDAFELLGLDAKASPTDIKARYLELSKIHHPDKGGDAAAFAQLKVACDTATSFAQARQCSDCRGWGHKTSLLPGTFIPAKTTCPTCKGSGKAFN